MHTSSLARIGRTAFPVVAIGFGYLVVLPLAIAQQNAPPAAPTRNLPPDEAFRLTLSLDEIRQANSESREQERRAETLRQWEEAQKLSKAASRLQAPKSESLPKLSLRDWSEDNQRYLSTVATRKTRAVEENSLESSKKGDARSQVRPPVAPHDAGPAEAQQDTTLRDYTSATTRALQDSGISNSVVKPLSPTMTMSNRNLSIWNRARPKPTPDEKPVPLAVPGVGSSGAGEFAAPGRTPSSGGTSPTAASSSPGSPYFVPSSTLEATKSSAVTPGPLEVVQSSFASPQFQHLPNPYPSWAAPNEPGAVPEANAGKNQNPSGVTEELASPGADNTATKEGEPATPPSLLERPSLFAPSLLLTPPSLSPSSVSSSQATQPAKQPGTTGPTKGGYGQTTSGPTKPGYTSTSYPGLAPLNGSQPFGLQPTQPLNPLNPLTPTIPRSSGPGANGFYEPKSITDLHYGR